MNYKVGDIVFSTIWKKSVLIKDIRPNRFYLIADLEYLSRTMVTYESNLKSREDDIEKDMEEHQKLCDEIMAIQGIEPIEAEIEEVWLCPEGYIFKDENDNVINATKIVLEKKKKEYPNNIYHCVRTLGLHSHPDDASKYKTELIHKLQTLLICRDAYWKIAGEEMGLGKPWEPDWTSTKYKYCITTRKNKVEPLFEMNVGFIFAFPTEEMRDAFYENFKEEIEQCKELL